MIATCHWHAPTVLPLLSSRSPPELRNLVYDTVFKDIELRGILYEDNGALTLCPARLGGNGAVLNITLLSKQIRQESLDRLWRKFTNVCLKHSLPPCILITSQLDKPLGYLRNVRSLVVDASSSRTDTILRPDNFPALRKFILAPYEPTSHRPHRDSGVNDAKSCAKKTWKQFLNRYIQRQSRKEGVVDYFILRGNNKYEVVLLHQWWNGSTYGESLCSSEFSLGPQLAAKKHVWEDASSRTEKQDGA